MATRGDRTREHILDVAERLFAQEGVANVSLRQIRLEAGQRNERAVQYHFADRAGLIEALNERHGPAVQAIQDRVLAAGGARPSLRRLVEAWARPLAEYGTRGPSERAWARIVADLVANPALSLDAIRRSQPPEATKAGTAVYLRLCKTMPDRLAVDRLWAVAQFVIHVSADRARVLDDPKAARHLVADDEFVDNLVAMAYGALMAPLPER